MKKAIAFLTALCMLGMTFPVKNDHYNDNNLTAYAETNERITKDSFIYEITDSEAHVIGFDLRNFVGKEELVIPDKVNDLPVTKVRFTILYGEPENIISISLPSSVADVSGFSKFVNLDIIDVDENNPYFTSDKGVLYSKDRKTVVSYPAGRDKIEISEYTQSIGAGAFAGCNKLETIQLPESVTDIGDGAFSGCKNLVSIKIPDSIKTIGQAAFMDCTSLESIDMPPFVTEIQEATFLGCSNLNQINLPPMLKIIKTEAFGNCENLKSIDIPENVTEICLAAFHDCSNLRSISFHESLKSIGTSAFINCYKLRSIDFPESLTEIQMAAFFNCTGLKEVNFHDGITKIEVGAFAKCSNLRSVILPKTIEEIGGGAFHNCKRLKSFTILNPHCIIGNTASDTDGTISNFAEYGETTKIEFEGVLYGYNGSTIQEYAKKYGYEFKSITDNPDVIVTPVPINPGEDNDPIIIVPGIMGSRLFKDPNCTDVVWSPDKDRLITIALDALSRNFTLAFLLTLPEDSLLDLAERININNELYVKNYDPTTGKPIDQNKIPEGEREYAAIDHLKVKINTILPDDTSKDEWYYEYASKGMLDKLCDRFPDREIYVFSYDWRRSNDESAQKLRDFVDALDTDKVDIVAHSMGGLVSSRYFSEYGGDKKIDKIITCGTPYEGAPHLFEAVDLGKITGSNVNDTAMNVLGDLTRDTIAEFDGVLELLPTMKYNQFTQAEPLNAPVMTTEMGGLTDINNYHKLSNDKYLKLLEKEFGKDSVSRALDFQDSIRDESNCNVLLNYDNAYFITGQNKHTVQTVYMNYIEDNNDDIITTPDPDFYISRVKYTNSGDGTVPYTSASMLGQTFMQRKDHHYTVESGHMDLMKNLQAIECVCSILNNGTPLAPHFIDIDDYSVITVACPVDVEIGTDNDRLCSASDDLSLISSFGRLDIVGKDNDIKMLCLDEDTNLDINLTGTDTGTMDFTVQHYSGEDELLDERIFEDVPITNKTIIKTKADNNEVTVLSVDIDGDGVVDETWTAKKNETVTAPDATIVTTTTNISTGSITTTSTTTTAITTTTATATADKRIVGSWYVSHVTIKTDSYDFTDDKGVVTFNNDFTVEAQSKITMDSDGKLHENDEYWTKNGTWSIKGDKYYATPSGIQETEFTYDAASDTISVSLTDAYLVMKRGGKITSTINLGDINNDGKVNAVDASIVLTYYAMISTNKNGDFTEAQKKAADVDNNGDINAVDASYILSYYAYTSTTKEDIMSIEEYMKKK